MSLTLRGDQIGWECCLSFIGFYSFIDHLRHISSAGLSCHSAPSIKHKLLPKLPIFLPITFIFN